MQELKLHNKTVFTQKKAIKEEQRRDETENKY